MRFHLEIPLNTSRDRAWRAFDDPANLYKWQPTLVSYEMLEGEPGQPGAKAKLVYDENGKRIEMIESITERREPELFAGEYRTPMAVNAMTHRLYETGSGTTRWEIDTTFRFSGFWRLLAPLFRTAIRKRLVADCHRFKEKLEAGEI